MKSNNLDKYRVVCISLKPILNEINFNEFLMNKRVLNVKGNRMTISLPNDLFHFIESQENRTKYLASLINKYSILLKNVKSELFFDFTEFMRFFLYLEYFQFINDIKIDINSFDFKYKTKIDMRELRVYKDGMITEIENGKEYLREYKDGIIIKENEIKKRLR